MYDEKTLDELLQMKLEERRQELLADIEEPKRTEPVMPDAMKKRIESSK